ncbi:hypothetical protein BDZ89DRAFT_723597 [Hymenopellis radicata]|nr:hypothetical protein BDZ89DRAFT_723597 [Hymenopellis radicata]
MAESTTTSSIPVSLPTASNSQSGSTTSTSSFIVTTSNVITTTTSASSSVITASSTSSSTSTSLVTSTSTSTTPIITLTSSSSSTPVVASVTALTTDSSGGVVTITRVVPVVASSGSLTSTAAASSATASGFMQNTGAVAGVFSLVGLLGFGILFVAFMTCVRRRRALKWDRELAAAAANTPRPHDYADFSVERDHDMHSTMGYKQSTYGDMQEIGMARGRVLVPLVWVCSVHVRWACLHLHGRARSGGRARCYTLPSRLLRKPDTIRSMRPITARTAMKGITTSTKVMTMVIPVAQPPRSPVQSTSRIRVTRHDPRSRFPSFGVSPLLSVVTSAS